MTQFSDVEIADLLRQLPAELPLPKLEFVVVCDCRDRGPPQLVELYPRAWAIKGCVQRPLAEDWIFETDVADRLESACSEGRAVVLIVGGNTDGDLVDSLRRLKHSRVVQLSEGFMRSDRSPQSSVQSTCVTRLTIEGSEPLEVEAQHLPYELYATPSMDGPRNCIAVSGKNDASRLPPPALFHLPKGVTSGLKLCISAFPERNGDRWQVTANGQRLEESTFTPVDGNVALQRIILIFDRTCPSGRHWSTAYRQSLGVALNIGPPSGGATSHDPFGRGVTTPETTATPAAEVTPVADLNLEIRGALAEQFRRLFDDEKMRIVPIWFADMAGPGLSWPNHLQPLQQAVGRYAEANSKELEQRLELCTYSPGLDIWDPLEKALELAEQAIREREFSRHAVLIVGNSPPNPPFQSESSLWNLLRLDGHDVRKNTDAQPYTTTFRLDTQSHFPELIDRILSRGVPIAYLFLTHQKPDLEHLSDFDAYQSIMLNLQQALSEHLHLEAFPANSKGIAEGLESVLRFLSKPPRSLVRLSRTQCADDRSR